MHKNGSEMNERERWFWRMHDCQRCGFLDDERYWEHFILQHERRMKSNRHANVMLRRAYADATSFDEIAFELGLTWTDSLGMVPMWVGYQTPGHEINHLNTNPRWDLWSNLIRLSWITHRWFHAHLNEGRILCLLAKAEKCRRLGDPREFDLGELEICRPNLAGWVESVELEPLIEPYRERLLELIAAKAKETA